MSATESSRTVVPTKPDESLRPDASDWSVLHLFANYKWTGPADPAIRCAVETRALGARVHFAQASWMHRDGFHRMAVELARQRMPVRTGLGLRKHFHVPTLVRDRRTLQAWLDVGKARPGSAGGYDVVHTHLLADHLSAAWAKSRVRAARPGVSEGPLLVRHLYEPEAPKWGWREQIAFGQTDGFVVPTRQCAAGLVSRFRFDPNQILVQDPPARRSGSVDPDASVRESLVGRRGDFLLGITARIQPHRRFELLWDVVEDVVQARPAARFVLFGRGNDEDVQNLCLTPLAERGLSDHVVLAGYLHEPEYTQALQSLDAFLFLVPGSDGTCRAVREAQALGLPTVVTDKGMLPEMVEAHGELLSAGPSGIVCDSDRSALSAALLKLLGDPELRSNLGASALARTRGPRDPGHAARRLLEFYERLRMRRRSG
ncbi:MAG: glycosyltransferase [Planctomycetota bacterium]